MRRQLLAATTLATLAGAFAVPTRGRALFQRHFAPSASTIEAALSSVDSSGFTAALHKAHVVDANGDNHLYFTSTDAPVPSLQRCGEVDAAKYMPASIFEPQNILALAAYAKATVELYRTPVLNTPVALGRCADIGYGRSGGGVQGIGWTPSTLMGPVCKERCQCNFGGGAPGLPRCTDEPDDPRAGRFCSLCGPSTSCPGCTSRTVTIGLWYRGSPSPPPAPPAPSTIVDLAIATPDLSTLVAALKAGDLVSTLSSPGPFTVFAPTNEAFAALPMGVLTDLLKPDNKAQLDQVLTYHVVAGDVLAADLTDGQRIKTVEGAFLTVRISGSDVFINSAKVITADVEASNGVVHIIDGVLTPPSADDASADQVVAGKGGKGGKGGVCSDDASFRDTYGTCATYVDNKWCAYGTTGPAWMQAWGALGVAAAKACCACGGGSITH